MGSFEVYAWSPTWGFYKLNTAPIAAVPGKLSYTIPWTVTEPQSSDYRLRVWYRNGERRLPHLRRLRRVFTIAPLTPAVSAPNGGEHLGQNGTSDVTWTLDHAVSVGSFEV